MDVNHDARSREGLRSALGRVGLWAELGRHPMQSITPGLQEVERQGWPTLWIPEGAGREAFSSAAVYLSATERLTIATGVASIHARSAHTTAAGWRTLDEAFEGRFVLGLGTSHASLVGDLHGRPYVRPLDTMARYLDEIDGAQLTAPPDRSGGWRVLAALGPKMLALAGERADGAHPYLVPVEHTAWARSILGPEPVLATEQAVVMMAGRRESRALARRWLAHYIAMPNYERSLRRWGFGDEDLSEISDRLLEAIVVTEGASSAAERAQAHLDAGADHVCIQVLSPAGLPSELPLDAWGQLAGALGI